MSKAGAEPITVTAWLAGSGGLLLRFRKARGREDFYNSIEIKNDNVSNSIFNKTIPKYDKVVKKDPKGLLDVRAKIEYARTYIEDNLSDHDDLYECLTTALAGLPDLPVEGGQAHE